MYKDLFRKQPLGSDDVFVDKRRAFQHPRMSNLKPMHLFTLR